MNRQAKSSQWLIELYRRLSSYGINRCRIIFGFEHTGTCDKYLPAGFPDPTGCPGIHTAIHLDCVTIAF